MTTDREYHDRLRRVFQAVHRLPESDRAAAIGELCGYDSDLRDEVERLLADATRDDGLADDAIERGDQLGVLDGVSAADLAEEHGQIPERIGRYAVVRVLGLGGMGVVYEAEQERPRRRVALKVIRPGMLTEPMLRRFRREADVLGRLTHPGIAQVYDVGLDESNGARTPFIAMELVNGEMLTEYAESAGLDTRGRLALAAGLCDAVEHAHQRGIIHRDLKPANILIDGRGQPKILDFGVARITESDIALTTLQTQAGQIVGTAAYMSPEQASGDPDIVDTRSDVYSLGVVVFELLSSRLPIDVGRMPLHEAVRAIHEAEPTRIGSINTSLRGDVETILAKALSRDPAMRYQSASELGADIRRYLVDEPIVARPPSTIYQLRKFARRHRALVVGVAAVMLTLVFGLVATSVALSRESAARDEAEEALDRSQASSSFLEKVLLGLGPDQTRGRDTELLEAMLELAASTLEEEIDSPAVRVEMQTILGKTYHAISDFDRAAALLDQASALAASLDIDDDDLIDARLIRANSHMKTGDYETAEAQLEAAVAFYAGEADTESEAQAVRQLAEVHMDTGRWESALVHIERAVDLAEGGDGVELGRTEMMHGAVLRRLRRFDEALVAYERSLALFRDVGSQVEIGIILNSLGVLARDEGRTEDSAGFFRDAIDIRLSLDPRPDPGMAAMLSNLGRAQFLLERYGDARATLERSLEMHIEVNGADHFTIAFPSATLGEVLIEQGEADRAVELLEDAVGRIEGQFGVEHPMFMLMLSRSGNALLASGRAADAETAYNRGIALLGTVSFDTGPHELGYQRGLGRALLAQGRRDEARVAFEAALERVGENEQSRQELGSFVEQCD